MDDPKMKPKTSVPQQMSAATGETTNVMQHCYSAALKGAQDYNSKFIEFTQANTKAAIDFAQRLSGAKSPSEFVELSTELTNEQLATLTEQTKQLAALAQQVTLATTEPLKTGFTKASTWS
jgi:phasin